MEPPTSYFYLLYLRLPEVTHVGSRRLVHEGSVLAVGLGQSDLVRNVGVDALVGRRLSREGRVVLLHQLLLLPNATLLLVPLLVANHLQVLDLGLRGRRQPLLHPLLGIFEGLFQFFPLVLVLDDVGLAHAEFGDGGLHLASEFPESALELVDFFADFQGGLPALGGVGLEFVDEAAHFVEDEFFF